MTVRSRSTRRLLLPGIALAAAGVLLAGCSSAAEAEPAEESSAAATSVEVEANSGTVTVELPAESVVATDNRLFETLEDWGIGLAAAPLGLMPTTIGYKTDESIVDLGTHNDPDLEAVVAVDPDLIINGQRFTQFEADFASLAPDAAIVDTSPRDGEDFADELRRQITVLGQVFEREDEADELIAEFDAAIERAAAAYDSADTVMAVNTSGGEIGYLAPGVGRTLGPVFDILGLTPALEVEGSTDDHQGDDISVEAIAASNPSIILVMDRDAAVSADDPAYTPAADILENSEALANVTAVTDGSIVYMPADTYTNESIQTYTEFFNSLADALEAR
jgi:iron complex transport system substrate-binding protein